MFTKLISSFMVGVTAVIGGIFGKTPEATTTVPTVDDVTIQRTMESPQDPGPQDAEPAQASLKSVSVKTAVAPAKSDIPLALTDDEVAALADNKYLSGNLPLGDGRYSIEAPKKGYVYLCDARKGDAGATATGPWLHGDVWNINEKISVLGTVTWPSAAFSNTVSGSSRTLSGNGLPISHATGLFPVAIDDPAHAIDPNPNSISAQNIKSVLPLEPVYSEDPYCMGGEVGVMLSGVPLFNGFDAGLRDAAAHEIQDVCEGHPQGSGKYHYHSLSSCLSDSSVKTVVGYALDGFPITGGTVAAGKYLTTEDLDVCHGITSEIIVDGKPKTTYHYVMTRDFPYSASCFRGKPSAAASSASQVSGSAAGSVQEMIGAKEEVAPRQQIDGGHAGLPPQEAILICAGKAKGTACSFKALTGQISGECQMVPEGMMACVP